jgi:hypothetical protein
MTTDREPLEVILGRWADGFRHAAANRHYTISPETCRETAAMFERAATELAKVAAERDALLRHCTIRHGDRWFAFTDPSSTAWTACDSEGAAIAAVLRAATGKGDG